MKHAHDFKIVLDEVLRSGGYRITKQCDCGAVITEESATGNWQRGDKPTKGKKDDQ